MNRSFREITVWRRVSVVIAGISVGAIVIELMIRRVHLVFCSRFIYAFSYLLSLMSLNINIIDINHIDALQKIESYAPDLMLCRTLCL